MDKNRFKKWVGMLFLLAIYIFLQVPSVYAADTCDDASKTYDINFSLQGASTNTEVKVTAKIGKFYIKILPYDYFDNRTADDAKVDRSYPAININDVFVGGTKDKAASYTIRSDSYSRYINSKTKDIEFTVFVYSADESTDACASKKYSKAQSFRFSVESSNAPITSVTRDSSACEWANNFINSGIDANMKSITQKAMAPCFNTSVSYNMSLASLNKIREKIESFYNNYYKKYSEEYNTYGANELPTMNAPWVKVDSTNLKGQYQSLGSSSNKMLTCDTKNEKTYQYLYYDKTEKQMANITLAGQSKSVEACQTQCREQIIISYGPPTAVIAGQCFTYEVEIKSKVTCIAQVNFDNFPDFPDYVPCEVHAVCNATTNYTEQAGPNDEFDSCVNSCDGGKYSQSCINSCYNKVYKKKTATSKTNAGIADTNLSLYRLDTLNIGKYTVQKMTNSNELSSACPQVCQAGSKNCTEADVDQIYNYVNQYITGNYINSSGTISYISKDQNCIWAKYGYSYFRDKLITARTACNNAGLNWIIGTTQCDSRDFQSCKNDPNCIPGTMRYRDSRGNYQYASYYASDDGFKREGVCQQVCTWQQVGDSCNYIDRETAENEYVASVENYLSTIQSCINTAVDSCDKTTSSTYTMTVNKDTTSGASNQTCDADNYKSNKNCLSWSSNHDKITKFDNMSLTENSIIKFIGGSCAHTSGEDDINYHTILTFPGAWVNNKNGEVTYDKPANTKWYKNYAGNYCTPLNAKNVNAIWWTWYQYHKAGRITQSFDEWAGSKSKDIVYNIYNTVNNFGLYSWTFNTACFYAVNDYSGDPTDPTPDVPSCTNSQCPPGSPDTPKDTSPNNYSSKSISTTTMFPSTKTSSVGDATVQKLSYVDKLANTDNSVASSSTRTQGYNWSVDATNLSIEGYPVTPTSLIKKVESTDAYSEDEVDYDITLSKTNISNIKKAYNSKSFSYTSFDDGKYVEVRNGYSSKYKTNGYDDSNIPSYSYYRSSFLRNNATINVSPKEGGLSCNNLKSSTSCDLLTEYTSNDSELINWLSSVR